MTLFSTRNLKSTVTEILSHIYNEKDIIKKLPIHLNLEGNGFTIAKLLRKFEGNKEKALEIFKQKIEMDRTKNTLEGNIKRYGEIEGPIRYKEKNSRLSVSTSALEKNGKSKKEIKEIKARHATNSVITEDNLVKRYGKKKGKQFYSEYDEGRRLRSPRCVEYWINKGCTEEEAEIEVFAFQIRDRNFFIEKGWTDEEYDEYTKERTYGWSLEAFIEKYGKKEGIKKYTENRKKGSDINWFIECFGKKEGTKKYQEALKAKCYGGAKDSKIQIDFAKSSFEKLPKKFKKLFFGAPIKRPFWINFKENKFNVKCCVPDIRIKNILIEFDGTYWHNREDNLLRDKHKSKLLKKLGYLIYRVPEELYKENKIDCINTVLKFIKDNIDINFHNIPKAEQ